MRGQWRALLLTGLMLAVFLARIWYPAAAEKAKEQTARILAADLEQMSLVRAMGRALSQGDWEEELIAALSRSLREGRP